MLTLTGTALTASVGGCLARSRSAGSAETPGTDSTSQTASPTATSTATETPDSSSTLVNGSFEDDWTGWSVGRDLPEDPNREGDRAVVSEVGVSTRDASDGTTSCQLFVDGSQGDGTVWIQQKAALTDYDYLAVDYRVATSFNEIRQAAVYTGPEPDTSLSEQDFDTTRSLEGHSVQGWKTFTYEVGHDGPGIIAIGFSVVWETGAETLLDNVRLTTEQPSTITPTASNGTN